MGGREPDHLCCAGAQNLRHAEGRRNAMQDLVVVVATEELVAAIATQRDGHVLAREARYRQRRERGRTSLDARMTVSQHAADQEPSKLDVPAGETISVRDAILALVTRSAESRSSSTFLSLAISRRASFDCLMLGISVSAARPPVVVIERRARPMIVSN